MSDDIVERLKFLFIEFDIPAEAHWVVMDGVDEIERLRAELRQVGLANNEFSLGEVRDKAEIERLRTDAYRLNAYLGVHRSFYGPKDDR